MLTDEDKENMFALILLVLLFFGFLIYFSK